MYLYTKLIIACMALTVITRYDSVHKKSWNNHSLLSTTPWNKLQKSRKYYLKKHSVYVYTNKILVKITKIDSHNELLMVIIFWENDWYLNVNKKNKISLPLFLSKWNCKWAGFVNIPKTILSSNSDSLWK